MNAVEPNDDDLFVVSHPEYRLACLHQSRSRCVLSADCGTYRAPFRHAYSDGGRVIYFSHSCRRHQRHARLIGEQVLFGEDEGLN